MPSFQAESMYYVVHFLVISTIGPNHLPHWEEDWMRAVQKIEQGESESSSIMSRNTALIKIIESVGKKVWLDHIIRTKFRLSAPLELQQIPNFYENSISLKD